MSFLALAAAADLPPDCGLSAPARLVLVALAHHHNRRTGVCYPGTASIAARTGLAERTVRTAIQELAGGSFIVVLPDQGVTSGGRRTSAYRLLFADAYARAHPTVATQTRAADLPERGAGKGSDDLPATDAAKSGDFAANGADLPAPDAAKPGKNLKNPPNPPGGTDDVRTLAQDLRRRLPEVVRKRSTVDEVETAIRAALKRRSTPDEIRAGVTAYYADPQQARDGGQYAKALHRIIAGDRFLEWVPDAAPAGASDSRVPGAESGDGEAARLLRAEIGTKDRPGPRLQRSWMDDWVRGKPWPYDHGPVPGEDGCRVSPEILAEFPSWHERKA